MSMTITVPTEKLSEIRVAQALADLLGCIRAARGAKPVAALATKTMPQLDLRAFAAALPDRSRRFLELLESRGEMRLSEVVSALDLSGPKAVGGITGAIGRWGPARGVALPYEVVSRSGERAWRWLPGHTLQAVGQAVSKKSVSLSAAPAAKQAKASAPKEKAAPARPRGQDALALILAGVPKNSRRFLELLKSRGRMTMSELLSELGLARAQALTSLLAPIRKVTADNALPLPFLQSSTSTGERIFMWPGANREAPIKAPAARPGGAVIRRRRRA